MNIFTKGGVDIWESDSGDVKLWDGQGYAWGLHRCYTRIVHTKTSSHPTVNHMQPFSQWSSN